MHEDLRPLEEKIAERLYQSVPRHLRADFRPFSSIGNEAREQFLSYAREAIRLAEWGRRKCVGEAWEGPDGDRTIYDRLERPLTLPPAGWKP